MRSSYKGRNRNGGRLTKIVVLAFSAILLLSSTGGIGAASASPAPKIDVTPAVNTSNGNGVAPPAVSLASTCVPHTYWITEFQMVWGPSASIPPCSWVNILGYRASATDTGWIGWCQSLGTNPIVIRFPYDIATCYNWFIPSSGQTPVATPPDTTVVISELQMVWGPAWTLPHNTFVKLMAFKASGSDAGWIFWCAQFNVASYDNTGNIGSCTVLWP